MDGMEVASERTRGITATRRWRLAPALVDRLILRELAPQFGFGIGIFLAVLLGVDLLWDLGKLMAREHLTLGQIGRLFLYNLPQQIYLVVPMATLLATLLAYGRLTSDDEVTAMYAGGVSFWRLAAPGFLVGLVLTGACYWFGENVVPQSRLAAQRLVLDHARSRAVQRELVFTIPQEPPIERVIYCREFRYGEGIIKDAAIFKFDAGEWQMTLRAREAVWRGESWELRGVTFEYPQPQEAIEQGRPHTVYGTAPVISEDHIGWSPEEIAESKPRSSSAMTRRELAEHIADLKSGGANYREVLVPLLVRYHEKLSTPFCCVVFVLVAIPLAVRPRKGGAVVNFGVSVGVILVYLLVYNTISVIGMSGAIPPVLAAWTANILLVAVGVGLCLEAGR
ncbi:MAG: LptF/LptG family permease [Armatimonadota bacterium]